MKMPASVDPVRPAAPALIKASGRWRALDLREVWAHRELLWLLAWRDISVRYKQSIVGLGWAVVQPLATVLVSTIIFGRLAKLPSDGVPYPLFALCALLPWNFFSKSLAGASASLVSSSYLVSKVYFPRLILPCSRVAAGFIDFAITLAMLFAMMAWYRVTPALPGLVALPVLLAVTMAAALGGGLWFAALNVRYRDVTVIVPFLTQLLMYASPVFYASSLVPAHWRWLYALNPMAAVIDGFRWALLHRPAPAPEAMLTAAALVTGLLVSGLFVFRKMEKTFADIV